MARACPLMVVLTAMALLGCGKQEGVPLYLVTGVVQYRGAPVAGATVVFRPRAEGVGAAGQTDEQGRFQLRTREPNDGAAAGEYAVVIQKAQVDSEWSKKASEMNFKSTQEYEAWKLANRLPQGLVAGAKSLLPTKYADGSTTPLRASVAAEPQNEFSFVLND